MSQRGFHILLGLGCIAIVPASAGCHLLFPLESRMEQIRQTYLFSAQIYRQLPGTNEEFTEWWFSYGWPEGQYANDPLGYCNWKAGEYVDRSVTPYLGMVWHIRHAGYLAIPSRDLAVDCSNPSYVPHTFGGPAGAAIRWDNPPSSQASASISLTDKDGVYRHADPAVRAASIDVAERTGMPDWSAGGTYVRGKQHIRFADMYFDLATPFQLGSDVTVHKCYLQSIGTVVGERVGTTYQYTIYPGTAKFFFYGNATKSGENGTTSFCVANSITQNVTFNQQGPYTYFAMAINLPSSVLGQNMTVQISLSKPYSSPSSFNTHQPVVTLSDRQADGPDVDLAPDSVVDLDGDLSKLMWFENFEASNEVFLGSVAPGNSLRRTFTPGNHEIAVVAYDARGAYGTAIATLTIPPPPSNDACANAAPIGDGIYIGSLVGSTNDGSATCGGYFGQPNTGPDAWYRYTAPRAGRMKVSTCGTNDFGGPDAGMDTVLSLHAWCSGTVVNQLTCNDDWPSGSDPGACNAPWPFNDAGVQRDSAVTLPVTAGQNVLIRVSKYQTGPRGVFYLLVGTQPWAPADFDHDGDVDLDDFLVFTRCFNGPNKPYAAGGCDAVDFDNDHDVDLDDFLTFTHCFNGPNSPPACS